MPSPFRVSLLPVAEAIDAARLNANADDRTAPQGGVYGHLVTALKETLVLMAGPERAERMYDSILDGNTIREARNATEPALPVD